IVGLELTGWPRPAKFGDLGGELMRRNAEHRLGWARSWAYRGMARHWLFEYRPTWVAGVPVAVRPLDVAWWSFAQGATLRARLLNGRDGPGPWQIVDARQRVSMSLIGWGQSWEPWD